MNNKYVFMVYFTRPSEKNLGSTYPDMIQKIMFIPERKIKEAHVENRKNNERFFFEDGRLFTNGEPILCVHADNEGQARDAALKLIESWFGLIRAKNYQTAVC